MGTAPTSKYGQKPSRIANRLLEQLSGDDYDTLAPLLVPIDLKLKHVLILPGELITDVFFPTTAVISALVALEEGSEVETGITGAEGLVGLAITLGLESESQRSICQVPGRVFSVPARAFRKAIERSRPMDSMVRKYAGFMLRQTGQGMACNARHPVHERLSRWLLMSHDRVGLDKFPMTHEFMGALLGVRRQSVTLAAGVLQAAGLITVGRGTIRVLDRVRLEEAACECYAVMRALYTEIFP